MIVFSIIAYLFCPPTLLRIFALRYLGLLLSPAKNLLDRPVTSMVGPPMLLRSIFMDPPPPPPPFNVCILLLLLINAGLKLEFLVLENQPASRNNEDSRYLDFLIDVYSPQII